MGHNTSFKIGKLDVHLLNAGLFWLDGGTMFGIVPKKLWSKILKADENNCIPLALNCYLLSGKNFLMLIEAGIGNWWDEKWKNIYKIKTRDFEKILKPLGISKEDITHIFVSHLHFDHIGGAVEKLYDQVVPTFPKAKIYVQKEEYLHYISPNLREKGSYKKEILTPLLENGKFEFLGENSEILPGIQAIKVGGHSMGMQILKIQSEGEVAYFLGDLIPTESHLKLNWIASYDLEPLKILSLKEKILEEALEEKAIFLLYHEINKPVGRLKKDMEGNFFLEKLKGSKNV
ncbi:MAG: MBL fold metallo-hydrolase [Thermoanaerobaculia bacterium]